MIHTILTLVLVLGLDASALEKKEKADRELLIGSWKLMDSSEPFYGANAIVTFTKDKKLKLFVEFLGKEEKAEGTWELKKKTLTTSVKKPENPKVMIVAYAIEKLNAKQLIIKDNQGRVDEFDRVVEKTKEKKK